MRIVLSDDHIVQILLAVMNVTRKTSAGWSHRFDIEQLLHKTIWKQKSPSFATLILGQLCANGWLERLARGTSTFYRVTEAAKQRFQIQLGLVEASDPPPSPSRGTDDESVGAVISSIPYHERACLGWRNTPGETPAEKMACDLKHADIQRFCGLNKLNTAKWFVRIVLCPAGIMKRASTGVYKWALNPNDVSPDSVVAATFNRKVGSTRRHFTPRQFAQRLWDNQPGKTVEEKPVMSSVDPPLSAMDTTSVAYAQHKLTQLVKLGYLAYQNKYARGGGQIVWARNPYEWSHMLGEQAAGTTALAAEPAQTMTLDQFFNAVCGLLARMPPELRLAAIRAVSALEEDH